ncbi:unnamed protein product [Calicophoron daubneyi]|uniref:Outer dynein arm-docking complex subunit 4 n=1 Tax=Calicophoron daubneyi TaxID=300641 RepID=A0AAV2TUD7_CALDB
MKRRSETKRPYSILQQTKGFMRLMGVIREWKPEVECNVSEEYRPKDQKRKTQTYIHLQPETLRTVLTEMFDLESPEEKQSIGSENQVKRKKFVSRYDYKRNLGEVFDEKVYLERLLSSEHMRARYLTAGSRRAVRHDPYHRIWLELMLGNFVKTSETVKNISADELSHIDKQYAANVQLNQWITLQDLITRELTTKRNRRRFIRREQSSGMDRAVVRIWKMYLRRQYREAAHEGVLALQAVELWNESKPSSAKWRFEADLCYIIGLCLDGLHRYKAALAFFQMDARLAEFANILLAKKRALDNIGRMYASLGRYNDALVCWNQRLNTRIEGEELAWLLYQIALCHTLMDDYKEATRFCQSCIAVAEESNCLNWELSANLLHATVSALAACNGQSDTRILESGLTYLEDAYNVALRIDRSCVINSVLNILRNVYDFVLDVSNRELLQRCWSASLLELLDQERDNRRQFSRIVRELLLRPGLEGC